MKAYNILLAMIFSGITFQSAKAQSGKELINDHTKTQVVKVYGECGMCKKRIEKTALSVEGVQSAIWSEDKNLLTLKYDLSKKDAVDNVQKKVAAAGHDTEKYKADDTAYSNLPDCCHYHRKP